MWAGGARAEQWVSRRWWSLEEREESGRARPRLLESTVAKEVSEERKVVAVVKCSKASGVLKEQTRPTTTTVPTFTYSNCLGSQQRKRA
jgi:hypothetical protein